MDEISRDRFAVYRVDQTRKTIELEWLDETQSLDEDGFRAGLSKLAGFAEQHPGMNLLVDVRRFHYRSADDNSAWRDDNIVPRYNAANVRKMAFLLPAGAAPGTAPAPEGPAHFPTGWFDSSEAIDDWIAGD